MYLAEDTNLERTVALKILPVDVAANVAVRRDPTRKHRAHTKFTADLEYPSERLVFAQSRSCLLGMRVRIRIWSTFRTVSVKV